MHRPIAPATRLRLRATIAVTVLASSLVGSSVIVAWGPAHAASNGVVSLRPADGDDFFHLTLYPGAALDAAAIVSNQTSQTLNLLSYPVDGTSTTAGSFVLASQTAKRTAVGAWIRMDAAPLVMPANSETRIPFRLHVPAGTPPGQYAGGLIVQTPPQTSNAAVMKNGDHMLLTSVQRVGVRIYLTVAGTAVTSLRHGPLTWNQANGALNFALPVRNDGNTVLHPTAKVTVTSAVGLNTRLTFVTPESVLPGGTLIMHAHLANPPLFESGSATATLHSEAGEMHAQTTLSYTPWLLVIGALLGLALGSYGVWRAVRFLRNNWQLINWA